MTPRAGCNLPLAVVDICYEATTDTVTVIETNPGGRFAAADEPGIDVADSLAEWLVDGTTVGIA